MLAAERTGWARWSSLLSLGAGLVNNTANQISPSGGDQTFACQRQIPRLQELVGAEL